MAPWRVELEEAQAQLQWNAGKTIDQTYAIQTSTSTLAIKVHGSKMTRPYFTETGLCKKKAPLPPSYAKLKAATGVVVPNDSRASNQNENSKVTFNIALEGGRWGFGVGAFFSLASRVAEIEDPVVAAA